jgi:hypothetical protein
MTSLELLKEAANASVSVINGTIEYVQRSTSSPNTNSTINPDRNNGNISEAGVFGIVLSAAVLACCIGVCCKERISSCIHKAGNRFFSGNQAGNNPSGISNEGYYGSTDNIEKSNDSPPPSYAQVTGQQQTPPESSLDRVKWNDGEPAHGAATATSWKL